MQNYDDDVHISYVDEDNRDDGNVDANDMHALLSVNIHLRVTLAMHVVVAQSLTAGPHFNPGSNLACDIYHKGEPQLGLKHAYIPSRHSHRFPFPSRHSMFVQQNYYHTSLAPLCDIALRFTAVCFV
mmetsp:Transcript_18828/g.56114  ORF Transcript_18828/g.56114 Transcript_18828/m.56114 type:complete len:127 (-) Transcript_18828:455-835(-)